MTNPHKDIITERYQQENPEGARLISEETLIGSPKINPDNGVKKRRSRANRSEEDKTPASEKPEKPEKPEKSAVKSRKPAGNSAKKKTASDDGEVPAEEQSQSVKTPSVMKLVEEKPLSENQVIAAGKSQIPRQLRGIEPLSRIIRRESAAMNAAEQVRSSPEVSRDLTEMVIADSAPEILRRFNACDCERCRVELSRLAEQEIPARYIKLPELADLSYDGFSREEKLLIASLKKTAVSVMIRLMIANKKRNFHG